MGGRRALSRARRVVVKVGSGLITTPERGPSSALIGRLAGDLAALVKDRREVALVSSGAIATGVARLRLASRPRSIPEKQAAAAVGQSALMWYYEQAFKRHGLHVGQVLLTGQDISDRSRYLNARNTLLALLDFGVLPIVNENDTVAVDEIKVGDNDNLAALVAHLIDADLLVLLTDVDGLYSGDPRRDPRATRLSTVEAVTEDIQRLVFDAATPVSVGGMSTKLQAAQKANASGIPMVIASGREPGVLQRVLRGEDVGTYFQPRDDRLAARKRWIAFAKVLSVSALFAQLAAKGTVGDGTKVREWYDAYFRALAILGWAQSDTQFEDYRFSGRKAEAHKAMIQVLTVLLGPAATALVVLKAALEALQSMQENSPWITLFSRESRTGKSARFQTATAQIDPAGLLQTALVGFDLKTTSTVTQFLFFKFSSSSTSLNYAAGKATIYEAALSDQRAEIKKRLADYRAGYIGQVKFPERSGVAARMTRRLKRTRMPIPTSSRAWKELMR